MTAVAAANTNVIVVINSVGAIDVETWITNANGMPLESGMCLIVDPIFAVKAVVYAGLPGQEAGAFCVLTFIKAASLILDFRKFVGRRSVWRIQPKVIIKNSCVRYLRLVTQWPTSLHLGQIDHRLSSGRFVMNSELLKPLIFDGSHIFI